MNTREGSLFTNKTMTIKEVADIFKVSDDSVLRAVNKHFPGYVENGKTTLLDEAMITKIKLEISGHHNLRTTAELPETDLEMMLLDYKVAEWKTRKIKELQEELNKKNEQLTIAAPKIESFDALMRSEKTMTISDCSKHFGLHPKTDVFPFLREKHYLTQRDVPSQLAIDSDIMALRETKRRFDGEVVPQACVKASQLENWRTKIVPRIEEWIESHQE